MGMSFAASNEQYTATLPAVISRPFTISGYLGSTDLGGTFRWAIDFSGGMTYRIGTYGSGLAHGRPGLNVNGTLYTHYTGVPVPFIIVCYQDGGSSQFVLYDAASNVFYDAPGSVITLEQTLTINAADFYGSDCSVGRLAIWNSAIGLDASFQSAILGKYVNPLKLQPQDLVHYWSMIGGLATEPDLIGGATLTRANSPGKVIQIGGGPPNPFFFGVSSSGDVTAPTVSSATIDAAGTSLTIVFTEDVTGDGTGFSIDVGSSLTATYVSGNGTDTWVFSLSGTVLDADTPTLDYDAGTGDMADMSSNVLATIVSGAVTNNSTQVADVTAPTLTSVAVTSSTTLTLGFSEAVTLTGSTGMTIACSGAAATLSTVSGDGTSTLAVTISRSIASTESLSFSYDSGTGDVEDLAGNALATISDRLVTNNISATPGSVSLIGPGLIQ